MRNVRTLLLTAITMTALAAAVGCGSTKPNADTVDPDVAASSSSPVDPTAVTPSDPSVSSDPAVTDPAASDSSVAAATTAPQGASESTFVVGVGPTASPSSVYPAGDIDLDLQAFIDLAVTDLSIRLGIDPGGITTHSAVVVVWPDSSLGCAQQGIQYTQVQTDGALIELSVGSLIYRYHAGGSTDPFLCSRPLTAPPTRLD